MILCRRLRKNPQERLLLLPIEENGPERWGNTDFVRLFVSNSKILILDFEKESSPAEEGQEI